MSFSQRLLNSLQRRSRGFNWNKEPYVVDTGAYAVQCSCHGMVCVADRRVHKLQSVLRCLGHGQCYSLCARPWLLLYVTLVCQCGVPCLLLAAFPHIFCCPVFCRSIRGSWLYLMLLVDKVLTPACHKSVYPVPAPIIAYHETRGDWHGEKASECKLTGVSILNQSEGY